MAKRRKREYYPVTIFFRVDGLCGAQSYSMLALDKNEALGMAWSALHWEALDLKLVTIAGKSIAYRARIGDPE